MVGLFSCFFEVVFAGLGSVGFLSFIPFFAPFLIVTKGVSFSWASIDLGVALVVFAFLFEGLSSGFSGVGLLFFTFFCDGICSVFSGVAFLFVRGFFGAAEGVS